MGLADQPAEDAPRVFGIVDARLGIFAIEREDVVPGLVTKLSCLGRKYRYPDSGEILSLYLVSPDASLNNHD